MSFQLPTEKYTGSIREMKIGGPDGPIVGGSTTMPFFPFDGPAVRPLIAFEVWDHDPTDWPESARQPFENVISDPAAWARACVDEHGAQAVSLQLISSDPNLADTSPDEAAELVCRVADAISVPLIVYGSGNTTKDAEVLKAVAEKTAGRDITIGTAQEDNYRQIVAPALGYGQKVIGETPIDVNLAKQLNILMGNLGLAADRILMDPSTGALGYGLEYTYSVIERDRLAALVQNDEKMQQPIICNVARESWKAKEARVAEAAEPAYGNAAERGILWEAITAYSLALAGADILIMRHPEAVKLINAAFDRHLGSDGTS